MPVPGPLGHAQQHRIPRASAQQVALHMDAGRQAGKNRMRNGARLARFAVRLEIQRGHKARMSPFFHRFQRGARPLATPVGGPNEDFIAIQCHLVGHVQVKIFAALRGPRKHRAGGGAHRAGANPMARGFLCFSAHTALLSLGSLQERRFCSMRKRGCHIAPHPGQLQMDSAPAAFGRRGNCPLALLRPQGNCWQNRARFARHPHKQYGWNLSRLCSGLFAGLGRFGSGGRIRGFGRVGGYRLFRGLGRVGGYGFFRGLRARR